MFVLSLSPSECAMSRSKNRSFTIELLFYIYELHVLSYKCREFLERSYCFRGQNVYWLLSSEQHLATAKSKRSWTEWPSAPERPPHEVTRSHFGLQELNRLLLQMPMGPMLLEWECGLSWWEMIGWIWRCCANDCDSTKSINTDDQSWGRS